MGLRSGPFEGPANHKPPPLVEVMTILFYDGVSQKLKQRIFSEAIYAWKKEGLPSLLLDILDDIKKMSDTREVSRLKEITKTPRR